MNKERNRSQSRSPAGPLMESYSARTMASRLATSTGRGAVDAARSPDFSVCESAATGDKHQLVVPRRTAVKAIFTAHPLSDLADPRFLEGSLPCPWGASDLERV